MSSTIRNLSIKQLKKAIKIRQKLDSLQSELDDLIGGNSFARSGASGERKMSAAGRARIAAAQRARWAKVKGKKGRKKMSAAGRAKIAAAARKRWKLVKAAGKTRL